MSDRLKRSVALVANTAWSIYNFRRGLIRRLIQEGFKVYAIAPLDDYADKLTAEGVTFVRLRLKPYGMSPLEDLLTTRQLFLLYRRYRFDQIIHYTIKPNIYGSIAARLARCRHIAVVTGLGTPMAYTGVKGRIIKQAYRFGLRCSDEVWLLNDHDREVLVRAGWIAPDRIRLLPSEGINTRRFVGNQLSDSTTRIKRFLFAGRLLKEKGILDFIAAAKIITARYSHVRFEVVGFVHPHHPQSITLDDLEQWQRAGYINYLGSHEDVRPYINRATAVVFPSYYGEGISRILLEAASMSRPIITTDHVGCRDVVIPDTTGFLIPPRDIKAIVAAMAQIIHMPTSELRHMGQAGRRFVQTHFEEEQVVALYFRSLFDLEDLDHHTTQTTITHHLSS